MLTRLFMPAFVVLALVAATPNDLLAQGPAQYHQDLLSGRINQSQLTPDEALLATDLVNYWRGRVDHARANGAPDLAQLERLLNFAERNLDRVTLLTLGIPANPVTPPVPPPAAASSTEAPPPTDTRHPPVVPIPPVTPPEQTGQGQGEQTGQGQQAADSSADTQRQPDETDRDFAARVAAANLFMAAIDPTDRDANLMAEMYLQGLVNALQDARAANEAKRASAPPSGTGAGVALGAGAAAVATGALLLPGTSTSAPGSNVVPSSIPQGSGNRTQRWRNSGSGSGSGSSGSSGKRQNTRAASSGSGSTNTVKKTTRSSVTQNQNRASNSAQNANTRGIRQGNAIPSGTGQRFYSGTGPKQRKSRRF